MSDIRILSRDFAAAEDLAALLRQRRITVATAERAQALLCSAQEEAALGGPRALMDKARAMAARTIFVVTEGAPSLTLLREMAGRLVRIGLPPPQAAPALDAALHLAADVIAAELGGIISADPVTEQSMALAERVARSEVSVFITGPTGSGKEVLARHVHARSRRSQGPFVAVNCAAIPENMLEAMLFGHEKGAFTGAAVANKGTLRAADGGTLLLDEVSEMAPGLQAKLLRVLQERRVTPLGSHEEVPVDVRIIATSNRDMAEEVRKGRFREDLYYRLHVFPLPTRPLRDRRRDIPALCATLIRRHADPACPLPLLTPETTEALCRFDWPGNVRELENTLQRALVLCDGQRIAVGDLLCDGAPDLVARLDRAV